MPTRAPSRLLQAIVAVALVMVPVCAVCDEELVMLVDHPHGEVTIMDIPCKEERHLPSSWRVGILVPNWGVRGRDYEIVCWEHAPGGGVTIHRFSPPNATTLPESAIRYEFEDFGSPSVEEVDAVS